MNLFLKLKRNFTILPYRYMKRAEYVFEPVLDLYARKFRKMALDASLLEKHKILIPANRTRRPEDTLTLLKQAKESAGVILGREEFPNMNIVLDQRQCFTLRSAKHAKVQNYYVRIPETDEMIRVTINHIELSDNNNWIPWIHFNRYIVGRPNLLYLPVKIRRGFNNVTINQGGTVMQKIGGIHVYCYNDDYPTILEVDPYNVTVTRSYKLGDLVNILPDGVVIHPKYKGNLGARVFFVRPNTFQMMVEKVRFETRNPEEEVAGMSLQDRMAVHKEGEDIEDDTVQEKRGGKTMFDKIVDKKTVIKEKDIDDIEAGEEEKTFAKIQREKLLAYKKEISQKAGKKTPFKSAKKSIMEDYSLKENFKDMKETKDKKGGGGAAEPTQK